MLEQFVHISFSVDLAMIRDHIFVIYQGIKMIQGLLSIRGERHFIRQEGNYFVVVLTLALQTFPFDC